MRRIVGIKTFNRRQLLTGTVQIILRKDARPANLWSSVKWTDGGEPVRERRCRDGNTKTVIAIAAAARRHPTINRTEYFTVNITQVLRRRARLVYQQRLYGQRVRDFCSRRLFRVESGRDAGVRRHLRLVGRHEAL